MERGLRWDLGKRQWPGTPRLLPLVGFLAGGLCSDLGCILLPLLLKALVFHAVLYHALY